MPYILGSVPFFDCYVRAEYTQGFKSGQGEFIKAYAHAVRCVRGASLMFQTAFEQPHGGVGFLVPIEAICWKPCDAADDLKTIQPWDVFSSDFGVCEFDFHKRGAVYVLPDRTKGQYRFTIDFVGSDLAEHFEQHKSLHIVFREDGLIGAYPNNRLLWRDEAFWQVPNETPRFESLGGEYRAEGHQEIFRTRVRPPAEMNGATAH